MASSASCVLVIELNGYIKKHFRPHLENRFARTVFVKEVSEAATLVEKGKPDLLIIDCNQEINAYNTIVKNIQEQKLPIPVITLLERQESELLSKIAEEGRSRILLKPVIPERFAQLIDEILHLSQNGGSNRRLIENAPDIIYRFSDKEGGVYYSKKVEEILGYTPTHLLEHPFLWNESIHPDDAKKIGELIAHLGEDENFDVEYRIRDKAGEWHWFQDRSITRWHNGIETIVEGIASDITARKEIEEAYRRQTEVLETELHEKNRKLGERVKELHTLYRVSSLLHNDLPLNVLMEKIIKLIPDGWQDPPNTQVSITLDDARYTSAGYRAVSPRQQCPIIIDGNQRGEIVVSYHYTGPGSFPFLTEEQHLLDAIASLIAQMIERRDNLAKLKKSEQVYREFVEGTDDLVTKVDHTGRFLYVNHKAEDIFGIPPQECIGLPAFHFVHPEDRDGTIANFKQWLREKRTSASFENRQIHQDGSAKYMLWTVHIHYNQEGKVDHINSIASDITRLKETEARFVKTSLELNEAQKIANIGSFECPLDTKSEAFKGSRQLYAIFGLEPEKEITTLEELFDHYIHPDDKEGFFAHRKAILKARKNQGQYNVRIRKNDGSYHHATFYCHPVYDESGKPYKIYGAVQDITPQIEAEEALEKSEKNYEAIFNATNEGFLILDPKEWEILDVNKAAEQIFGLDKKSFLQADVQKLSSGEAPYSLENAYNKVETALAKGQCIFEWHARKNDGTLFWIEVNLKKATLEGKERVIAAIRDVTQQKENQLQMEASEKKLRTVFDNANEGFLAANIQTKQFLFANRKMCEMLGYSEAELLQLAVHDIHPTEELPKIIETFEKQAKGELKTAPAMPLLRKDGSVIYVEVTSSLVDQAERPYMIGVFKDISDTHKLLNQLLELKENLSTAQEIARMGTFEHDLATQTLRFSKPLQKILGLPASKTSMPIAEFAATLAPETAAAMQKTQQDTLTNGRKTDSSEVRYFRPDGRMVHLFVTVTVNYDKSGNPVVVRGLMQDITEQRELENELRNSEKKFRSLVEMTNTVPWRYDLVNDQYSYVGPQVKQLWGYSQDEWNGATIGTWYKRIHADDRDRARAFCLEETSQGRDHTLEFRAIRPDGRAIWIRESISVVTDHGKPVELIGYMFDINEQKEAELALKESEELFRTLSENILTGIILYSRNRIIYVNPAAEEILGFKHATIKKQFTEKRLTPNLLKILTDEKSINHGSDNLTMFYKEIEITTKGGKERWIQIETNAVTYRGDAVRIAVFTDITEEKYNRDRLKETTQQLQEFNTNLEIRIEEEIEKNRQKEQMMLQQSRFAQMGEMLSMIAHQWRQPLNAISATAINLRLDNQLGELNAESTEERAIFIEKQAERMSETINDFMQLFRPAKNRTDIRLLDVIHSVNKIIGAQMKSRDIKINVEIPDDLTVMGTFNELEHVIINLIANARDAFDGQGNGEKVIGIKGCREQDGVTLKVSDNAGGIPPDILDRVFDAYFTTKLDGKGTGIGLYMTKTIVERNFGGTIEVANTKEGVVFTISFKGKQ